MSNAPEDQEIAQQFLIARLNAKLQPMHRGEFFEDPLHEVLEAEGFGEVTGGGTMQDETGEIQFCEIEIAVPELNTHTASMVAKTLEALGAPKGSVIQSDSDDNILAFGVCEGLAIYLNGTELPDNVYKDCDSNFVYAELERLTAPNGRVLSYWQGPTETAFYLYGHSFSEMRQQLAQFVATYPLCQKCRIEQVA
jgi:hypothetical protein